MSWGTKRRNRILFVVGLFILVPIAVVAFVLFYKPPTCFDGKKNSDELNVDCGGSCALVCTSQAYDPVVLWKRYFKIDEGVYNALAYIENPNPSAQVTHAHYIFKMYNEDNIIIGEREGFVTLAPKSVRPVIETNILTNKQRPTRIDFEFDAPFVFQKKDPKDAIVLIKDEKVDNEKISPRVKAKVQNISLQTLNNIDVIVILYDVFDSVIGTSSTFVPELTSEQSKDIVFTWPQPFNEDIARIEVIPIYDFN